jgi:hypothetical protein
MTPHYSYINKSEAVLEQSYSFAFIYKGESYTLTIPVGFVWDGATIPRIGWSIVGLTPFGIHDEATLIHDYLYEYEGEFDEVKPHISRSFVDAMFIAKLKDLGYSKWQLAVINFFVRVGGFYYWREL